MVLSARPNWSVPLEETLSFKTQIFTSRAGKETRFSNRTFPRQTIGFEALTLRDDFYQLPLEIRGRNADLLQITDFTQQPMTLTQDVLATDTSITVDGPADWFQSGTQVVLWSADNHSKILTTISAPLLVGDEYVIQISGSVDTNILTHGRVYTVVPGRLTKTTNQTFYTDRYASWNIDFDTLPGTEIVERSALTDDLCYFDVEALLVKPDWMFQPRTGHTAGFENVDFGRGIDVTFRPIRYNSCLLYTSPSPRD